MSYSNRPGDDFVSFMGHLYLLSLLFLVVGWVSAASFVGMYAIGWWLNRTAGRPR